MRSGPDLDQQPLKVQGWDLLSSIRWSTCTGGVRTQISLRCQWCQWWVSNSSGHQCQWASNTSGGWPLVQSLARAVTEILFRIASVNTSVLCISSCINSSVLPPGTCSFKSSWISFNWHHTWPCRTQPNPTTPDLGWSLLLQPAQPRPAITWSRSQKVAVATPPIYPQQGSRS